MDWKFSIFEILYNMIDDAKNVTIFSKSKQIGGLPLREKCPSFPVFFLQSKEIVNYRFVKVPQKVLLYFYSITSQYYH